MIHYYQPFLLPFLHRKRYRVPDAIQREYFVSFEDALWKLLPTYGITHGSTILVPDFYCMDVVNNIQSHGYTVRFYALDDHFQNIDPFSKLIKKTDPAAVIIFHACGIRNKKADTWIRENADGNLLIIEDAVQTLTDPRDLRLYGTHHVLIDSVRKVLPLPGSFLYQTRGSTRVKPDPHTREWSYFLRTFVYFSLFRMTMIIAILTKNIRLMHIAYERILKRHDELIGDSIKSHAGYPLIEFIHRHIHFEKIRAKKYEQVQRYQRFFRAINVPSPLYKIKITNRDTYNMHVYPVGLRHTHAQVIARKIELALHEKNIPVWFKFPDAPWCKTRAVLYLPLGFHISDADIHRIMETLLRIEHKTAV